MSQIGLLAVVFIMAGAYIAKRVIKSVAGKPSDGCEKCDPGKPNH